MNWYKLDELHRVKSGAGFNKISSVSADQAIEILTTMNENQLLRIHRFIVWYLVGGYPRHAYPHHTVECMNTKTGKTITVTLIDGEWQCPELNLSGALPPIVIAVEGALL